MLRDFGAEIDQAKLQYRLESGFPNYFGPQRFGRHNLDDALIGCDIGEIKAAADVYHSGKKAGICRFCGAGSLMNCWQVGYGTKPGESVSTAMTWGPVKPVKQTYPMAPYGGAVLIRCQAQP